MVEETVKLTMALSIPVWAAMAVFVIVAAIYGGVSGLGIAFAAVFFATIFWFVAVTRIIGGEPREARSYRGTSVESRLSAIEDKLDQISRMKKE